MSLVARIGRQWHPLARLNTLVMLVFVVLEFFIILTILLVPTSLSLELATTILQLTCAWWLIAFLCLVWVSVNAAWVAWRARRKHSINVQNVLLAWTAPIIILVLWLTLPDVLQRVVEFRANRAFDSSRSDLLVICERIYAEGEGSESLGDDQELGVYSHVDVRFRDSVVYFQIGDALRESGYVCVQEGNILPEKDQLYEYEKIDHRFYSFQEIENLLTPQPDTPTPFVVPGSK